MSWSPLTHELFVVVVVKHLSKSLRKLPDSQIAAMSLNQWRHGPTNIRAHCRNNDHVTNNCTSPLFPLTSNLSKMRSSGFNVHSGDVSVMRWVSTSGHNRNSRSPISWASKSSWHNDEWLICNVQSTAKVISRPNTNHRSMVKVWSDVNAIHRFRPVLE